ncbi:tetratricopeptide repeat protein [Saccharopolyspora sp. NPDC050389]|uniref:tetratricopeptide repeat protein n=1 Tax=Saccharopolyspora sp. NPDC050389 TaxID=3155516 RepID=UPI0033F1E610
MSEISGEARDLSDIDLLRRRCEFDAAQQAADAALALADSAELRVLRGRVALDRIAVETALVEFERALELDPESERAHAWRVAALARSYRYDEALEFAESGLERFPDGVFVRVALGRLLMGMERPSDAMRHLEKALAIAPDDVNAIEWRCLAMHAVGELDAAVAASQEAVSRLPDEADLLEALAYLEIEQLRYESALRTLDRALEVDPWHALAHERKILLLRLLTRFDQAEQAAAEALARLPHSPDLLVEYALIAARRGRDELAVERIERAVVVAPDNPVIADWHATFLRDAKRPEDAETVLDAALAVNPESPRLLLELAWLRTSQDRHDEAVELARTAVRIDPYRMYARTVEIGVLRVAGRLEDAEKAARSALRQFPSGEDIRLDLVNVLSSQGRNEKALQECLRFLDDNPHDVDLISARCNLLDRLRRYDEELAAAQDAQRRFPDVPALRYLVGRIHRSRADYDAALPWVERTLDVAPAHVDALESRALILRLTRRFDQAEEAARAGLRKVPTAPELHEELSLALSCQSRYDDAVAALEDGLKACGETWYLCEALIAEYTRQGRHVEALQTADRALRLDPGNVSALLERFDALMELRRFDEVDALAARLAAEFGEDEDVIRKLGWREVLLGRVDAAIEFFRRNRGGNSPMVALQDQVKALRIADRYDEAAALLREELALDPDSRFLLLELSRTFRQAGRFEDALRLARRAQRAEPHSRVAVWDEIIALQRMRLAAEAEAATLAAIERFPHDLDFPRLLSEIYADTNRPDQALSCLDKILSVSPYSSDFVVLKAGVLRKQRRYREAERVVLGYLRRYPRERTLLVELGWIQLAQRRFTEAEKHFSGLLDDVFRPGERINPLLGLGWVALRGNDIQKAQRHFRAALELDPRDDENRLSLAAALLRDAGTAQHDEVERLCLGVLEDDPCDDEAHALLGVLNFRRGNHAAAEHHLRTAVELVPGGGPIVDLAALYSQLGRFDEAEKLLDQAVERDWYDVQAHVELGNVYLQRDVDGGEPGEWAGQAAQQFRQATVLDPGNGTAAIGLARSVMRSSGDLVSAEEPLRYALDRSDCDLPKWRLQVELARLLVQRGDATGSEDLYLEALAVAREAIGSASDQAEPHFVAGVAAYKIGESGDVQLSSLHFRRAMRYLRRVEKFDSRNSEAHRLRVLAQQRIRRARSSVVGSTALITVSLVMLALLWSAFFLRYQVPTVLLGTLTPVLVAMVAIGFLLPLLVRLKLPGGLEADLSASLHQVSSGPTGEVTLGSGRYGSRPNEQARSRPASLSEGPRGELSGRS